MFDTAAGQAARSAVKGAKDEGGLKGEEKAVFAALEQLQDQDDKPNGYSQSEIIKVAGPGGGRRPALKALAERGVLTYGKDREGRLLNGEDGRGLQYRIPTGIGRARGTDIRQRPRGQAAKRRGRARVAVPDTNRH
jgi:hypothetical protein